MTHEISAIPRPGGSWQSAPVRNLTMNRTNTHLTLPDSNHYAVFRQRIATAQRRMENLFSLSCVGVLLLMPIMFALAHIAADGAVWNFATGEKFDPFFKKVFWAGASSNIIAENV